MRGLADAERLRRFLEELAREAEADVAVHLTGGATAVLLGWRKSTIDADILMVPEQDSLYRALPRLKEELQLNVEIASPAHFIPELPEWQERSLLIEHMGRVSYYHYDPYSQALASWSAGTPRTWRTWRSSWLVAWWSRSGSGSCSRPSSRGSTATPPSIPRRSGRD